MPIFNTEYKSYKPIFEYSYDFRNKSVATLQADWYSFTNTGVVSFDSNGMRMSSRNYAGVQLQSLSDAKKITLNYTQIVSNSNHDCSIWLSSNKDTTNLTNFTWIYTYASGIHCIRWWTETANNASVSWTYNVNIELDLVNKTSVFKFGSYTYNYTLSDTDISNIRSDLYFSVILWKNNVYIKDISITVEY